jgi:hypothetical protein
MLGTSSDYLLRILRMKFQFELPVTNFTTIPTSLFALIFFAANSFFWRSGGGDNDDDGLKGGRKIGWKEGGRKESEILVGLTPGGETKLTKHAGFNGVDGAGRCHKGGQSLGQQRGSEDVYD